MQCHCTEDAVYLFAALHMCHSRPFIGIHQIAVFFRRHALIVCFVVVVYLYQSRAHFQVYGEFVTFIDLRPSLAINFYCSLLHGYENAITSREKRI